MVLFVCIMLCASKTMLDFFYATKTWLSSKAVQKSWSEWNLTGNPYSQGLHRLKIRLTNMLKSKAEVLNVPNFRDPKQSVTVHTNPCH